MCLYYDALGAGGRTFLLRDLRREAVPRSHTPPSCIALLTYPPLLSLPSLPPFSLSPPAFLRITNTCHDDAARFVRLLAGAGQCYITEEDFELLIQVSASCRKDGVRGMGQARM